MSFLRRLFGSGGEKPDAPAAAWPEVGEGPFDVEKVSGEFQFQVTFDDAPAHLEENRVSAFVELLGKQPGVKEAGHEDREVVLVKAHGMSQAEMQAAAERAWEEAGKLWPPSDDEDADGDG